MSTGCQEAGGISSLIQCGIVDSLREREPGTGYRSAPTVYRCQQGEYQVLV